MALEKIVGLLYRILAYIYNEIGKEIEATEIGPSPKECETPSPGIEESLSVKTSTQFVSEGNYFGFE